MARATGRAAKGSSTQPRAGGRTAPGARNALADTPGTTAGAATPQGPGSTESGQERSRKAAPVTTDQGERRPNAGRPAQPMKEGEGAPRRRAGDVAEKEGGPIVGRDVTASPLAPR